MLGALLADLFKALISCVVLGIPFLATWWGGAFLIYWADKKMAPPGRPPSQTPAITQLLIFVWCFAGAALGFKVMHAISSATGIK